MTDKKTFRAIYIGTPNFSAEIFEKLIVSDQLKEAGVEFSGLITNPDRLAGRGNKLTPPAIKTIAEKYGVPVFQFEKIDEESFSQISKIKPDIMIMCAFSQILLPSFLKIAPHGVLNIHYSLLPKWRGPSPVQYSILSGDKKTGVTIILADDLMDHGSILAQKEEVIEENDDFLTLLEKLTKIAAGLAEKTIIARLSDSLKPKNQNDDEATYCRMINKQDGKILWEKTSSDIINQVRAFKSWPGSYSYFIESNEEEDQDMSELQKELAKRGTQTQGIKMLKITDAMEIESTENSDQLSPGIVFLSKNNQLAIKTGDTAIAIKTLQMEGGKEIEAKAFVVGHSWVFGKQLYS